VQASVLQPKIRNNPMLDTQTAWRWALLGFTIFILFILFIWALGMNTAGATWKPEYGKSPPSVQLWFQNAQTTLESRPRINYIMCCEQSERLRTKFVGSKEGEWSYYPNPNCISAGCPLFSIPNDVVHADRIKAIDPKDDDLPEFKQMRRDGVLFLYHGHPTCFWPPESGI
jgi:hypothetical protein